MKRMILALAAIVICVFVFALGAAALLIVA
jgi:hypothetical protein